MSEFKVITPPKSIFLLFLYSIFSTSLYAEVIGVVDGVKQNKGTVSVVGWACEIGSLSIVDIHITIKDVKGVIAHGKSSLSSEDKVNQRCKTTNGQHRFKVEIPTSSYWQYNGEEISAFGISPSKSGNAKLKSSQAVLQIPKADVIGYLDRVIREGDKYYLLGWACLQGQNKSIDIQIKGKTVINGKANLPNGNSNAINKYCKTKDSTHRFKTLISNNFMKENSGISPSIYGVINNNRLSSNNIAMGSIVRIPDLKYEKLNNSVPKLTLQYALNDRFEISTGANIELKNKGSKSSKWTKFPLSPATAHASAWRNPEKFIVVSAMKGTMPGAINKLTFSMGSGDVIKLVSNEKAPSCKALSNGYCVRNPHDILYDKKSDYFYFIDSEIGKNARGDYLVRFRYFKDLQQQSGTFQFIDLTQEFFKLYQSIGNTNLTPRKSYSRSIALINGNIHISHTSYGDVIVVEDFAKKIFRLHHFGNTSHPVPSGTFTKNGLVLNEVEYFNGYYYGTNYYDGSNEAYRLVRWKNWQDFNRGSIEDLSYYLEPNTLPYYLTVIDDSMYLVGLKENRVYAFTSIN